MVLAFKVKAQQTPQYSQYKSNYFLINPAVAGTKQKIDFRMNSRMQWQGFESAPFTSTASFHTRFYKDLFGLGAHVIQDEIGPFKSTIVGGSAAFHLIFPDVELSLGGSGIFSFSTIDASKITVQNPNDELLNLVSSKSTVENNVNVGIFLYNDRFSFGLSALQFLEKETELFDLEDGGVIKSKPHLNMLVGYNYSWSDDLIYENSIFASYVFSSPMVFDYTVKVHMMQRAIAGLSYRLKDAFVLHAGFYLGSHLQLTYSYDVLVNKTRKVSGGSHELMFVFSHNITHAKNRFLNERYQKIL